MVFMAKLKNNLIIFIGGRVEYAFLFKVTFVMAFIYATKHDMIITNECDHAIQNGFIYFNWCDHDSEYCLFYWLAQFKLEYNLHYVQRTMHIHRSSSSSSFQLQEFISYFLTTFDNLLLNSQNHRHQKNTLTPNKTAWIHLQMSVKLVFLFGMMFDWTFIVCVSDRLWPCDFRFWNYLLYHSNEMTNKSVYKAL